jgi:hypothetical protein
LAAVPGREQRLGGGEVPAVGQGRLRAKQIALGRARLRGRERVGQRVIEGVRDALEPREIGRRAPLDDDGLAQELRLHRRVGLQQALGPMIRRRRNRDHEGHRSEQETERDR